MSETRASPFQENKPVYDNVKTSRLSSALYVLEMLFYELFVVFLSYVMMMIYIKIFFCFLKTKMKNTQHCKLYISFFCWFSPSKTIICTDKWELMLCMK